MRLIVHDHSGHPFQVQLSRWLANQGHQVLHIYSSTFQTPKGSLIRQSDDPATFNVIGIKHKKPFQKYSFVKRRFQEIEYGYTLSQTVREFKPNVLISSNTPIDTQKVLWKSCQDLGIPKVFWVQDIYGVAMKKILGEKLPLVGRPISELYTHWEKKMLRESEEIVSITEDFNPLFKTWGVPLERVTVIPNWAPLDEILQTNKSNPWSKANKLNDDFVFLYSGTLGKKHNPDALVRLAQHYKQESNLKVVVISEGLGAQWLKQQKQQLGLDNLILMDFQPFGQMSNVLGSADVLIALLEADAGVYSVPSKVLTYLCAGKPLLLAVPDENLAAKIVSSNQAGHVVTPGDIDAFVSAAEQLKNNQRNRANYGNNARNYAVEAFDIDDIGNRFSKIINKYQI